MESEDDYELLMPSSPVHERRLKRLKKAIRVSEYSRPKSPDGGPSASPIDSSEFRSLHSDSPDGRDLESSNGQSEPESESFRDGDGPITEFDGSKSVKEDGSRTKRVLEFDSVGQEFDGKDETCPMEMEKGEEFEDPKTEEPERKRPSLDSFEEKKEKNKKKRIDEDGGEMKPKESTSNKRKAEKERQDNLKQLRAESQRLLRETRDAAFKPVPLVQKPISSILDKIRRRKLEISKKSAVSFDDDGFPEDDDPERACLAVEITDKVKKAEPEETPTCSAATQNNLNASHIGGSNDAADNSSSETIASPVATGLESEQAFRAPINDTQDLFSDSQRRDGKDEAVSEKPNNPLEDVSTPSMLAMNLKLDSAPLDIVSSDEEDNDKENIEPHLHGSVDLPLPPSGDPVKAFVDEEAEEEDDSDNDLLRFQDNEDEDEDDDDDVEELNNMIATEYEEKPSDREWRDQLHQQWLEQQDTAGMDVLLQKLNCGSKLKQSISIEEEEDEESKETEKESDDEAEEYIAPSDATKINLKKVKQMIPQMFTDKNDAYVSSDDEEIEKRLAKQCLSDRAEEQATFLSPAEDESSREVFSLIKKLNIVPDTKRKGRTPSLFDMPLIGQNINICSKSFVGRAPNHFMSSSQKHGASKVRSFIFGRDDSNSRTSISMSKDSSDTIPKESQPPKAVSVKYQRNTQNKYTTLNSTSQKSSASLLEILRRSSLHAEHCVQNVIVQQQESVFDAFKLAKKPIKTEGRG